MWGMSAECELEFQIGCSIEQMKVQFLQLITLKNLSATIADFCLTTAPVQS